MDYAIQDLTDGERVVLSANLLDTSEFEIFRHAWQEWFGHPADKRTLESEFSSYLYLGSAPPWVRHYTRGLPQRETGPVSITRQRPDSWGWLGRMFRSRVARVLLGRI